MTEQLRIGVVGAGIGREHVRSWREFPDLFEVRCLCDVDETRAQAVAAEYGVPHVLTDLEELCRRDDVDVIDLCTPSHMHHVQTLRVLEANKHVVCEKPVAGSLAQVDELIRVEKQSGKRVMPIFQYRFGHGAQKLKYLIDRGLAGRAYLTTVETAWRRKADYYAVPWRGRWQTELGGPLLTLAIHAQDLVYYMLGPARNVFAHATTRVNPIETEDCLTASIELGDGSLCAFSVTTGSAVQISRHRFCFSNLVAESNTQPYNNTADPWIFTGDTPELEQQLGPALAQFQPQPERHAGQFLHFYHALQTGSDLPVTLADARVALESITAIYYSAQTHQPVTLPLASDHPRYGGWQPGGGSSG